MLTPAARGLAPGERDKLERLFARFAHDDRPGCAICVTRGGETVWTRCYGLANLEDRTPITPETVFRIGSVSKHLLATVILALSDRRRLSLDDRARKFLPELPPLMEGITLRHLLTMSSGLPDGLVFSIFAGHGDRPLSRAQHLALATRMDTLMFPPGTQMLYSNTNYLLLSTVVERITGEGLEEVMRRELFAPLGMSSARLEAQALETVPGKAKGYVPGERGYLEGTMLYDASGDGGVDMSIADFATWLNAYRAETLLGPGYRARMEAEVRFSGGIVSDYRLGLNVDDQHGSLRVGHAGGMPGYLADLCYFPESDLGVVLLTNLMDVSMLNAGDDVLEALTGATRSLAHEGPAEGYYLDAHGGMALQIGRSEDGVAWCSMMGERALLRGDKSAGWTPAKRGSGYRLDPVTEPNALTVRFGSGAAQRFTLCPGSVSAGRLEDFEGAYRSAAMGETHYVRRIAEGLEVTLDSALRELSWRALTPRATNVFSADIPSEPTASNLTLRFERDSAGRVTGFRYSTFRCRQLLFARVNS